MSSVLSTRRNANRWFKKSSRTPITNRKAQSHRHLEFQALEDRSVPTIVTGSVVNPDSGLTLNASADFTQVGTDLHIFLQNTTSTALKVPTDVLTAVFFDVSGNPLLTRGDATLHTDSIVINAPLTSVNGTALTGGTFSGSGDVGGEFGYAFNSAGLATGLSQQYGVSNSGLGIFGPDSVLNVDNPLLSINLEGPDDPDGGQYGIVGAAGIAADSKSLSNDGGLIKNGVDIVLHGYAGQDISNVRFQFGTSLDGPHTIPRKTDVSFGTTQSVLTEVVGTDSLQDVAHISGSNPTGTITFNLFDPKNTIVYTGTINVTGNGNYSTSSDDNSNDYIPNLVGIYHWVASYSGDDNNNPLTAQFNDEPVVITKASPTIATFASQTADGVVGSAMLSDSATITGGYNVSGKVIFTLTAPNGDTVTSEDTDFSDGITSGSFLATQVGTYTWSAEYVGNDLNNGAIDNGENESLTTIKASPTIATVASQTADGVVGSAMLSDSATITGGYNVSGKVIFTLTAPDGSKQTSEDTDFSDGITSGSFLATQVGTYTWSAEYVGNDLNNGAIDNGENESLTTIKASPTIATIAFQFNGNVVGTSVLSDTAKVTGGYLPGGSVTFTLKDPNGNVVDTETVPLVDGMASTSNTVLATLVGTYTWHATYNGNDLNNTADDNGDNELLTTVKASPSIATVASQTAGGVVGTAMLSDSATITGGFNVTGKVVFTLTAPNGQTYTSEDTNLADGITSASVLAMQVGTYTWSAKYVGDDLNNEAIDNGENETLKTIKASPKIVTKAGDDIALGNGSFSDTATLSGGYAETGTITFRLYSLPNMTTPVYTSTPVVTNGDGDYTIAYTPAAAGTYQWVATFNGDSLNNAVTDTSGDAEREVAQNGLTLGFYSNKNGQNVLTGSQTGTTLQAGIVSKLFAPSTGLLAKDATYSVLIDGSGNYVKLSSLSSYTNVKNFLLAASATNMANMLSAQLLTLEFNVYLGYVNPTVSVQVSKVTIPSSGQYMSSTLQSSLTTQPTGATAWTQITTTNGGAANIQTTMNAAIAQLKANPYLVTGSGNRIYQEALKDIFDGINNNESIFI